MSKLSYLDPISWAFHKNPDLELGERVGVALKEAARYVSIEFDRNFLPKVRLSAEKYGGAFHFSNGLTYNGGVIGWVRTFAPEEEENLLAVLETFDSFQEESAVFRSMQHERVSGSGAEWGGGWGGHANPDFGKIINIGTNGIRRIINEYKEKNTYDADWFYRGCEAAMDAIDILGDRFRDLALEMADKAENDEDREKLLAAARTFEICPREPAPDFVSAIIMFWLIFTFDGGDSPGRFDQYMYRTYQLTEDPEVRYGMLERLWEAFHDLRAWNLCLSGSDENWCDETNPLTYDILKVAREKKFQTPNITLRVHRNTPAELWSAIADTLATGIGMPALYNDEVVCPALEKIGIPPCDSHDYCMNGCNQIDIMGKSHMGLEDGEVIFSKCLEFALHNGVNDMTGEFTTIHTGDPTKFETYEQFERAYMRQMEYVTRLSCTAANNAQHARAIMEPNPFRSCLIDGCLEKGIDYRNGGPLYNHGQILAEGIADTGDSLWAIKKLIFDEKKYTMAELIEALKANYEGYDQLYHDFASCEKFGNDIDAVDEITARILNRFFVVLKRNHTYRGGIFTGGCSTFSRAAGYGRSCAALPNGKRRGEPLLADSIAATPGRDVKGPTASMKSVLRYNHSDAGSGFVFQIKFDKKLFDTEKGKATFINMAKAFFAGGGQQYTVTVVSPEDLLDAKVHPECHRDLIVRVGGYSDYFVNLEEGLQDNIIERTFIEV